MKKYKILSVFLSALLLVSSFTVDINASRRTEYSSVLSSDEESIADAIDNLEDEKNNNSDKIAELEKEISEAEKLLEQSEDDENAKIAYQNAVQEKMNLQQENILYVEKQISALETDIAEHKNNIEILETEISEKQIEIDKGIEDFKARLNAMYISGNASYASIITGSKSFYDLLSRMELIKRISEHDNKVINNLKEQLADFNEAKALLETETTMLNQQVEESDLKKNEYSRILEDLSSDYNDTQEEIERIALEQQSIEMKQSEREEQIKTMEEEQKAIDEEIRKAQEEIKRIREEEEKRRKEEEEERVKREEEERLKREEEERKKQEALATTTTPAVTEAPVTTVPPVVTTTPPVTTQKPSYNNSYNGGSMLWPVPGHYIITDYYGTRTWDGSGFHYGLDLGGGNIAGSSIVASESGTVILAINYCTHNYAKWSSCGCGGGFGNYVVIDHGGTYATLYAHCEKLEVKVGDYVTKGQTIGYVGTTGYSTGYHLHFEVRKDGERVNPLEYIAYQ